MSSDFSDAYAPVPRVVERVLLGMILLLFAGQACVGITWGLPGRDIDPFLFAGGEPWPGEMIYRLAGVNDKFSPTRGADVDVAPPERTDDEPILLTGTPEDVAKIYLRYRLYTHQPDEMITMVSLAGMNPRQLRFDPRLYQYGGLFIYPVGAMIGAGRLMGLIDVRSDVTYYLDHPDEFGKFYIASRAYAAGWGLIGVLVVFAIARRLSGTRAGLLAALLFTLMPVVVCMSHESKPHLPGAVLMLAAVYFAMRHLGSRAVGLSPRNAAKASITLWSSLRNWRLMCACCGAALGMVLSSWPIFVLIPLVALMDGHGRRARPGQSDARSTGFRFVARRTATGTLLALFIYVLTNPYVALNLFINREVLYSNFSNSLAMYEITRIGEGFLRVLSLTIEGATLPVAALGLLALFVAYVRRTGPIMRTPESSDNRFGERTAVPSAVNHVMLMLPLVVAAGVFFLQFVAIGAGKPAEYGRFGVFPNAALAVGAACVLSHRWFERRKFVNAVPAGVVIVWVGFFGTVYLLNFRADQGVDNTRLALAGRIKAHAAAADAEGVPLIVGLPAEPAPYNCPPWRFDEIPVMLASSVDLLPHDYYRVFLAPIDRRNGPEMDAAESNRSPQFSPRGWRTIVPWPRVDTPISWANKPFRVTVRSPSLHKDKNAPKGADESSAGPRED